MAIQFQRLLDVCRATEELPLGNFNMRVVCRQCFDFCGTVGCMIGNYNAIAGRHSEMFGSSNGISPIGHKDWDHFGITRSEYFWLFAESPVTFTVNTSWQYIGLRLVTREQALARLRKFIYYKMHKAEMIVDEKYGVREEARTKEGNHGFAARAVRETKEAMAAV